MLATQAAAIGNVRDKVMAISQHREEPVEVFGR
jgi:hypothetical protein